MIATTATAKDTSNDAVDSLNKALEAYKQATIENDIDTILSYMYPKLFELASREQMKAAIQQVRDSGMAPQITKFDTDIQLPLEEYSDGVFVITLADTSMEMSPLESATTEENESMVGLIQSHMGNESDVRYDDEKNLFYINKIGKLIAINEASSGWKFVDYEQAVAAAATSTVQILPTDIAEKIINSSE